MQRKNFFLPDPLIAKLRKIAKLRGVAISEVVRTAIEEYVNREPGILDPALVKKVTGVLMQSIKVQRWACEECKRTNFGTGDKCGWCSSPRNKPRKKGRKK